MTVTIILLSVAIVASVAVIVRNNYVSWKSKQEKDVNFSEWIKRQR